MAGRLAGKVAIVTGAGSGIGAACAKRFVEEGAKVFGTDINFDAVKDMADALGPDAFPWKHDVASEDEWRGVIAETKARFGGLHILVNNAGIGRGCRLTEVTLESWREQMAINLDGVFLGIKHAIPAMIATGSGSIINMSSVDAFFGAPVRVPYCASKGGVAGLTKAAAMECCEFGDPVRVNSVHPGPTATAIFANAMAKSDPRMTEMMGGQMGVAAYYLRNTPMTRFADPSEIADGVLYLASDESRFVTGTELRIDGGFTAGKLINQRLPEGM